MLFTQWHSQTQYWHFVVDLFFNANLFFWCELPLNLTTWNSCLLYSSGYAQYFCLYRSRTASWCFLYIDESYLHRTSACIWHHIIASLHLTMNKQERKSSIALVFTASDSMVFKCEPSDRILCNYAIQLESQLMHNNETALVQFIPVL